VLYQAVRISASCAKPYLLIEGDSTEVERLTKNSKSFYGTIANVTLACGLRILYTANVKETAMAIAELVSQARTRALSTVPSAVPPKAKSMLQQQLHLVYSMHAVGRELAERLLMKCGTPRRVMSLMAGELALTRGIGWKRAERIREMLDMKFTRSPETKKQMRLEG